MDRSVLERKSVPELRDIASALQMTGTTKLRKAELIDAIISQGSADADADADDSGVPSKDTDVDGPGSGADDPDDAAADGDDSSGDSDPEDTGDDGREGDDGEDRGGKAQDEDSGRSRSRRTRTRSRETSRRQSNDSEDDGSSDDARAKAGRGRERRRGGDADADSDGRGSKRGSNDGGSEQSGRGRNTGGRNDGDKNDGAKNDGDKKDAGRNDGGRNDGGRNDRGRYKQSGRNSEQDGWNESGRSKNQGGKGNSRSEDDPGEVRAGVLDILPEGYGFLRTTGYLPGERDVYVSQGQIRKQRLRRGDVVQGPIRQQRSNEKVPALHHVERVNLEELEANQVADRPDFDDLPSIPLTNRIDLSSADSVTVRAIDLVAPQADGQRTVIKVPPSVDGASLLVDLAADLAEARPESHLMMLTIDARPEVVDVAAGAVTGEIIASTFEKPAEDHTQIAELAIERARRLVELGHDVIVLIDSISRLARAYGVAGATGGRTVAPDVEAAALYPPKQLLAAAKATDGHGSLTIIATLLTDTGSAYDEVVEREFTRIANSTVVMDAGLAIQGIEPPVSVLESHTYLPAAVEGDDRAAAVADLRRSVRTSNSDEATMEIMDRLRATLSGGTGADR